MPLKKKNQAIVANTGFVPASQRRGTGTEVNPATQGSTGFVPAEQRGGTGTEINPTVPPLTGGLDPNLANQGQAQAQTGGLDPNLANQVPSTGGLDPNLANQGQVPDTGGLDPNPANQVPALPITGGLEPNPALKQAGGTGGFLTASQQAAAQAQGQGGTGGFLTPAQEAQAQGGGGRVGGFVDRNMGQQGGGFIAEGNFIVPANVSSNPGLQGFNPDKVAELYALQQADIANQESKGDRNEVLRARYANGGTPEYLAAVAASGYFDEPLGSRPGAAGSGPFKAEDFLQRNDRQTFGGGGGGGGGAGGGGGGGGQGSNGGTSFSSLIEGGLTDLINSGGASQSEFGQQSRQNIQEQLQRLSEQPGPTSTFEEVTERPTSRFEQPTATGAGAASQRALVNLLGGGEDGEGGDISNFIDQRVIDRNTESLREGLDRQRNSQTDQLRARLAALGLGGSGAEATALGELERDLAGTFASGARDIGTGELTRARGTFEEGLRLGESGRQFDAGLAEGGRQFDTGTGEQARQFNVGTNEGARRFDAGLGEQARQFNTGSINDLLGLSEGSAGRDTSNLLGALGQGTGRQAFLTDAALRSTEVNQAAAEFAAQFGLQREQVMESIRQNRTGQLAQLLSLFMQGAQIGQRGAVDSGE